MSYEADLQTAVIAAIFDNALKHGDNGTAILDSGIIANVLVESIAFVVHTSSEVETPAKTRATCDRIARELQRKIAAIKASDIADRIGLQTMRIGTVQ
jgi:hypothetical protein